MEFPRIKPYYFSVFLMRIIMYYIALICNIGNKDDAWNNPVFFLVTDFVGSDRLQRMRQDQINSKIIFIRPR